MLVKLLSMARQNYSSDYASRELNRRNQLAWARMVFNNHDKMTLSKVWTLKDIKKEERKKCQCRKG